jgi:hypothetical protein
VRNAVVLDGRVLEVERAATAGAGRNDAASRRIAAIPADSIFDVQVVTDSGELATYRLCPGDLALVFTTTAEARRLGLRARPPALCIEAMDRPYSLRTALPVGTVLRVRAGGLDILHECDLGPPPEVRWASSDTNILTVDSTGVVGRRPGRAMIIASAGGAEVSESITVIPYVSRIEIVVADSVITVGDTVIARAFAKSADGERMLDVPVELWVTDLRGVDTPPVFFEPRAVGQPSASIGNAVRIVARRPGSGWIRAFVVGRADSLRLRAR